jgi:hypothetical protein
MTKMKAIYGIYRTFYSRPTWSCSVIRLKAKAKAKRKSKKQKEKAKRKSKINKRTTPRIPTWSPTVVLTRPDDA